MLDLTGDSVVLPAADGVGSGTLVDLSPIIYAMGRLQEIPGLNAHKAGELKSALGKAWGDVRKSVAQVTGLKLKARSYLRRVRADTLLMSRLSAADQRRAAVDSDPGVVAAQERLDELETFLGWLESQSISIRDGYYEVRRVVRDGFGPPPPVMHGMNQPKIEQAWQTAPLVPSGTTAKRLTEIVEAPVLVTDMPEFAEPEIGGRRART